MPVLALLYRDALCQLSNGACTVSLCAGTEAERTSTSSSNAAGLAARGRRGRRKPRRPAARPSQTSSDRGQGDTDAPEGTVPGGSVDSAWRKLAVLSMLVHGRVQSSDSDSDSSEGSDSTDSDSITQGDSVVIPVMMPRATALSPHRGGGSVLLDPASSAAHSARVVTVTDGGITVLTRWLRRVGVGLGIADAQSGATRDSRRLLRDDDSQSAPDSEVLASAAARSTTAAANSSGVKGRWFARSVSSSSSQSQPELSVVSGVSESSGAAATQAASATAMQTGGTPVEHVAGSEHRAGKGSRRRPGGDVSGGGSGRDGAIRRVHWSPGPDEGEVLDKGDMLLPPRAVSPPRRSLSPRRLGAVALAGLQEQREPSLATSPTPSRDGSASPLARLGARGVRAPLLAREAQVPTSAPIATAGAGSGAHRSVSSRSRRRRRAAGATGPTSGGHRLPPSVAGAGVLPGALVVPGQQDSLSVDQALAPEPAAVAMPQLRWLPALPQHQSVAQPRTWFV
jgi:hypothetical protein